MRHVWTPYLIIAVSSCCLWIFFVCVPGNFAGPSDVLPSKAVPVRMKKKTRIKSLLYDYRPVIFGHYSVIRHIGCSGLNSNHLTYFPPSPNNKTSWTIVACKMMLIVFLVELTFRYFDGSVPQSEDSWPNMLKNQIEQCTCLLTGNKAHV